MRNPASDRGRVVEGERGVERRDALGKGGTGNLLGVDVVSSWARVTVHIGIGNGVGVDAPLDDRGVEREETMAELVSDEDLVVGVGCVNPDRVPPDASWRPGTDVVEVGRRSRVA